GIVILPAKEGARTPSELLANCKGDGVTGMRGVVVQGPNFLRRGDFEAIMRKHLGQPLTFEGLSQVQAEIRLYCQNHDHPVVDVVTPEQELPDHAVQIVVIEGRVGQVTVENTGRQWFS